MNLKQKFPAVIFLLRLPMFDMRCTDWRCQLLECQRHLQSLLVISLVAGRFPVLRAKGSREKTNGPQMKIIPSAWSRAKEMAMVSFIVSVVLPSTSGIFIIIIQRYL